MPEVAIVAALEREVRAAVNSWRVRAREYNGHRFKFFEKDDRAVLVCGGIGSGPARRACEAAIALYHPKLIVSLGFAGALVPELHIAQPFAPVRVIDGGDGRVFQSAAVGSGTLLSFGAIASAEQKRKLAAAFSAQAVDMEAAAVALGAEARQLPFMAYKAISDPSGFEFPDLEKFIDAAGQFRTVRFAMSTIVRPWIWARVLRLAINSRRACATLCRWLDQFNDTARTAEFMLPACQSVGSSRK